jgi:DNA polymerase III epsilon subunit-like protein
MINNLIEINKSRIETIVNLYLYSFFENESFKDIEKNYESFKKLKPTESEIVIYRKLKELNSSSSELISLEKKLSNWRLLDSLQGFDNFSLAEIITHTIDLENKNLSLKEEKIKNALENKTYYLFFDTETTGLPISWKAPITDLNNWPRLVQLAYILFDEDGNKIEEKDFIIKPNGFTIPKESSLIHGITTEKAIEKGHSIEYVLNVFFKLIEKSQFLVAHNISFDEKIMGSEFLRNNFENLIEKKEKICTMEKTTNYCKLEGQYGYKWPKLSELHNKLFGYDFDEAHNASVDIKATAKCFWELRNRKIL